MISLELIFAATLAALAGTGLLAVLAVALPSDFVVAAVCHRSNHTMPARQIGGLAVVPVVIVLLLVAGPALGLDTLFVVSLASAAAILLVTGHLDDRSGLSVPVRIAAQLVACAPAVYGLGPDFKLVSTILPRAVELPILVLALMWFINLTNFMDGLDLMTAAGLGIPLAAVVAFALLGLVTPGTGLMAALMAGALAGFGLFNRPPARIFLGDAGSLPVGLMAGICFFKVAQDTHLTSGFMLPLYFSADASVTVIMRLIDGQSIFTSHSRHAYQVARRNGWSVARVIAWVAVLNVLVALCALAGAMTSGVLVTDIAFAVAAIAVAFVLWRFRRAG